MNYSDQNWESLNGSLVPWRDLWIPVLYSIIDLVRILDSRRTKILHDPRYRSCTESLRWLTKKNNKQTWIIILHTIIFKFFIAKNVWQKITNLLELPTIRHSGNHLSEFILMALNYPVDVFFRLTNGPCIANHNPFFDKSDEFCDVVKFSLFQNAFLCQVLVYHQLSMTKIIQNWTEVCRVPVY